MPRSIYQAHGEMSQQSKDAAAALARLKRNASGPLNSKPSSESQSGNTTSRTKPESPVEPETDTEHSESPSDDEETEDEPSLPDSTLIETERSESGTMQSVTNDSETFLQDEPEETLPVRSEKPLLTLKPGISLPMSLIDESAEHLLELQKSFGKDLSGRPAAERNPQAVNAACNCAGGIAKLIKLKLDAAKLMHDFGVA